VGEEELGDRPGIAGQELAVGAAVHAVVGLLDGLLGGGGLLAGSGGAIEAEQAGDLGDREAGAAVEQEVAEQAGGVVVGALRLAEVEGGVQQAALLGGQTDFGDLRWESQVANDSAGIAMGLPPGRRATR
jgi:hypothetical protein